MFADENITHLAFFKMHAIADIRGAILKQSNHFQKMKNIILLFCLLAGVAAVNAQQPETAINSISLSPNIYKCTTNLPSTSSFQNQDLITWIFPDGQYKQKSVSMGSAGLLSGTNEVEWIPYTHENLSVLTGDIKTFVARKGGSGPPPSPALLMSPPNSITATNNTTIPAFGTFPNGRWRIGQLWEFSQKAPTYVVVSYHHEPCSSTASDFIELSIKNDELELEATPFGYNSEVFNVTANTSNGETTTLRFTTHNPTGNHGSQKNIFFALKPKSGVQLGQTMMITGRGQFCPSLPSFLGFPGLSEITFDTLRCLLQGGPHDPNYKIVDVKTIPFGQNGQVELTYTIQFHNDGTAPVKKVVVTDILPAELDPSPSSFKLLPIDTMNGIHVCEHIPNSMPVKEMTFTGPGLPGLGQTNRAYSFDQTIFRFKFKVKTNAGNRNNIANSAGVEFYDGDTALEAIITNDAVVQYAQSRPCRRCKAFWREILNFFRREKLPPCR